MRVQKKISFSKLLELFKRIVDHYVIIYTKQMLYVFVYKW